jgi:hypothetical protein
MVVALQPVVYGVLGYLVIAFSPLLLLWTGMRVARVAGAVSERRAAKRRAGMAQGMPLERLVSDLRRLRAELVGDPPSTAVQRTGLLMAYDSVLRDTCARLEIPTGLDAVPPGPEREFERLRAEAAIQEAGISLHTPRRRAL